jgi:hypothetical protein
MMQLGVVPPVTFPTDSRYYGYSVLQYTAPDGQVITYLARRIVPQPGAPNLRHHQSVHGAARATGSI